MLLPGKAAGAEAVRVNAYETRPGSAPHTCEAERQMLCNGSIHALAFTSTAEVIEDRREPGVIRLLP